MNLFDKVNAVFSKKPLTKQEIGRDMYMILRVLSMHPEYVEAVNRVQKYQGVLGHRLFILLQAMFKSAEKAPFFDYVKRTEEQHKRFSDRANKTLKDLFFVSQKRLEEYMPNLYVTEEEINEVFGYN